MPRDLFNEAKLLKCLGQLALIIHDGVGVPTGLSLVHEIPEAGFQIEQDSSSGELYCGNLECRYKNRLIGLRTLFNSKKPFPLQFILDDEEGPVFNSAGGLSIEFFALLQRIK